MKGMNLLVLATFAFMAIAAGRFSLVERTDDVFDQKLAADSNSEGVGGGYGAAEAGMVSTDGATTGSHHRTDAVAYCNQNPKWCNIGP
ncbi:hypothetical protein M6B38_238235 [Iris pallida]|uniref:Uncharacterized protein n=1 Tax=Iris pallida TaxID=29817 RepID=A0AAX6DLC5_IRIPA|nr:hypothetical protein M6B38_238235 [Iris pallida]